MYEEEERYVIEHFPFNFLKVLFLCVIFAKYLQYGIMKITLLVVGRTVDNNITAGIKDYTQRVGHFVQFDMEVIPELKNAKKLSEAQQKELEMQLKDQMNQRDNETKILVATISANSNQEDGIEEPEYTQEAKDRLMENMRQFDARLKLDRERLEFDREKARTDASLKREALKRKPNTSSK